METERFGNPNVFRAFDKAQKTMSHNVSIYSDEKEWWWSADVLNPENGDKKYSFDERTGILMRSTGVLSDRKMIFEHDIRRIEEEEEEGDIRRHYVCTWIKEWTMFAWLMIEDREYQSYLDFGISALDEPMFWTYPVGQEEEFDICGNIYERTDLMSLSPKER